MKAQTRTALASEYVKGRTESVLQVQKGWWTISFKVSLSLGFGINIFDTRSNVTGVNAAWTNGRSWM